MNRRAALRRWKNSQMLCATYGSLLRLFVDAAHAQCAEALCAVLEKKQDATISCECM